MEDPVGDDIAGNDRQILTHPNPLGRPPEIERIRRGYVTHFMGAFINDGLESWQGIDLDRSLVISVARRIADRRADPSRSVTDPQFPSESRGHIFARKFSSPERVELEVVSTLAIDMFDLEAFVCVANAAWAAPVGESQMISDGFRDAWLLDQQLKDGAMMTHRKPIYSSAPFDGIDRLVQRYMLQATW